MKRIIFFVTIIAISAQLQAQGQPFEIPSAELKTLEGEATNSSTLGNDGNPFIICFWASWSPPCNYMLNIVNDYYPKWKTETKVKIYAISIDEAKNKARVMSMVKSKKLKLEVLLDENSKLKEAMGVKSPPHIFIFDGKGNLVKEKDSYSPGDENKVIYESLKSIK